MCAFFECDIMGVPPILYAFTECEKRANLLKKPFQESPKPDKKMNFCREILVITGFGFCSKFNACYIFEILNLTSEKGSIFKNRQLSDMTRPACTR